MQWIWTRFTKKLTHLAPPSTTVLLSTNICIPIELLHMPRGVYFPARKIPKYWLRTCQGLNSVSLWAPKSHLNSFGICKQSVTPSLPGLTWHAFSEHTSQIRRHPKLSKKSGGESPWSDGQSTHAACVKWGSFSSSEGISCVLQAVVSSHFRGWRYSCSWRWHCGWASQDVLIGKSRKKSRGEIKCNQHGWKW